MKPSKKKKIVLEDLFEDDDVDDGAPVSFDALEKLTSSDVISQVKAGMSHIAPIEFDEAASDLPY